MQIGIFAKTFVRPTLEATLDAVVAHDLHCLQFNMACAGLASRKMASVSAPVPQPTSSQQAE